MLAAVKLATGFAGFALVTALPALAGLIYITRNRLARSAAFTNGDKLGFNAGIHCLPLCP